MKRKLVLFFLCMIPFVGMESMATDIEARTGIIGGDAWGLQAGAYINFPQSQLFSIQTGILLHTVEYRSIFNNSSWNINANIPVYASFHLPVSEKVKVRLNGGGYFGTGDYLQLGITGEAGLEVKRFFLGVNYFHNFLNDRDLQLGLLVAYKFLL